MIELLNTPLSDTQVMGIFIFIIVSFLLFTLFSGIMENKLDKR